MAGDEFNLRSTGLLGEAWAEAQREWASLGPRMLERNLAAISRHYGVEAGLSRRPPTRLILEWCEEDAPTAGAWIEAKLHAIAQTSPSKTLARDRDVVPLPMSLPDREQRPASRIA